MCRLRFALTTVGTTFLVIKNLMEEELGKLLG